jgi:hypothetical protein
MAELLIGAAAARGAAASQKPAMQTSGASVITNLASMAFGLLLTIRRCGTRMLLSVGRLRTTQRSRTWLVEVSIGRAWRAAGW